MSVFNSMPPKINEIALIILQLLASNNCCSAKNLCKSYVVIGFGRLVSKTGSTSVNPYTVAVEEKTTRGMRDNFFEALIS